MTTPELKHLGSFCKLPGPIPHHPWTYACIARPHEDFGILLVSMGPVFTSIGMIRQRLKLHVFTPILISYS